MNTILALVAAATVAFSAAANPAMLSKAAPSAAPAITADTALDADAVGGELEVLSDLEISLSSEEAGLAEEDGWYAGILARLEAFFGVSTE